MLTPRETTRFRRDLRRMRRRGKDIGKLELIVQVLVREEPLPDRQRDHPLVGDLVGFRECHVEPDWLLIYGIDQEQEILTLVRTGTHSDLFDQ